jgi:hypothetical protein
VLFESPDPQQSFAEHAQDSSDFAVWFRERIKQVSGSSNGAPESRIPGTALYVPLTAEEVNTHV